MSIDPLVVSLRQPKRDMSPQEVGSSPAPLKKRYARKRIFWVTVFVVSIGVVGVLGYVYRDALVQLVSTKTVNVVPEAQRQDAAVEVGNIVEEVGALIMLPDGETPTVATVTEPEKLKDQAFFAHAKVGDKVLLYTIAKKAYLYDPLAKKLIEVAPITTELQ